MRLYTFATAFLSLIPALTGAVDTPNDDGQHLEPRGATQQYARTCGVSGYEKGKYKPFKTIKRKCDQRQCRDYCHQSSKCRSYALSKDTCRLYAAPAKDVIKPGYRAPYKFYDRSCACASKPDRTTTRTSTAAVTTSTASRTPAPSTTVSATTVSTTMVSSSTTTSSSSSTSSTAPSPGPNVLRNPSFEDFNQETNAIDFWRKGPNAEVTAITDEDIALDGSSYVALRASISSGPATLGAFLSNLDTTSNYQFKINLRVMEGDPSSCSFEARIRSGDRPPRILLQPGLPSGAEGWVEFASTPTGPPDSSPTLVIAYGCDSATSVVLLLDKLYYGMVA